MRNQDFRELVSLLERDKAALRNFVMEGASDPRVAALLSEYAKLYAANTPGEKRLANALLRDDAARPDRADRWAECVDFCEASRFGGMPSGRGEWGMGPACPMTQCGCSNAGTCSTTCSATSIYPGSARFRPGQGWRADRPGLAAGCDANQTCSCTSATCGGATCGGSTCSATCTGDSCGSTCGDSCNWTTNLDPFGRVGFPLRQVERWR